MLSRVVFICKMFLNTTKCPTFSLLEGFQPSCFVPHSAQNSICSVHAGKWCIEPAVCHWKIREGCFVIQWMLQFSTKLLNRFESVSELTTLGKTFLDFPPNCFAFISEVLPAQCFPLRMEEHKRSTTVSPPRWTTPASSKPFLSLLSIWHPVPTASLSPARMLLRHDGTGGGARRSRCGSWPVWELLTVWTLALPDAPSLPALTRASECLQHNKTNSAERLMWCWYGAGFQCKHWLESGSFIYTLWSLLEQNYKIQRPLYCTSVSQFSETRLRCCYCKWV